MPFRALDGHLMPDELAVLGRAFDGVCEELGITHDNSVERERVARLVLTLAKQDDYDAAALQAEAIDAILRRWRDFRWRGLR